MLEFSRLRAFNALARHGSVHAAAVALHCTPSAISQQLAKLERETATVLYEKDGRGLRLTDAGRVLAASAVEVLDRLEQAEAELAAHHSEVQGRLTIAAFATACRALLPVALTSLHRDHERLHTSLLEINPYEAIDALTSGVADIAVVDDWPEVGWHLPDTLSHVELGLDVADLIVPRGHPLAGAKEVRLPDIRDERWISAPVGAICHDWLRRVVPGVQPDFYVGEFETQLILVAAGLGVALVPRLARTTLPEETVAVAVGPTPTRRVMVVWRNSSAARPAINTTAQALMSAWAALPRGGRGASGDL